MPSVIIGRAKCPECGFEGAHIKQSEKCLYRYCPECGINGPHAKTAAQKANMQRGMRPVTAAAPAPSGPTSTPTEAKAKAKAADASPPTPAPTPSADTAAAPMPPLQPARKRLGLFG
jgi:predicted  nucleic acid-binding Zn-ribbon protein